MKGEKHGEAEVAATKWRALIEQNASRGKLWAAFGVEQLLRRMWDDGRWQHETPYQEEFELVRHSTGLRIDRLQMHQAHNAVKSSDLGNFLGHIPGKRQAQRMDNCESETMLQ